MKNKPEYKLPEYLNQYLINHSDNVITYLIFDRYDYDVRILGMDKTLAFELACKEFECSNRIKNLVKTKYKI